MSAQILTVKELHTRHAPHLCLPSLRVPSLCLLCAVVRLERSSEPTALKKFIVGELSSIIEGDGAGFWDALQRDMDVLERLVTSVTSKLLLLALVVSCCKISATVQRFLLILLECCCSSWSSPVTYLPALLAADV